MIGTAAVAAAVASTIEATSPSLARATTPAALPAADLAGRRGEVEEEEEEEVEMTPLSTNCVLSPKAARTEAPPTKRACAARAAPSSATAADANEEEAAWVPSPPPKTPDAAESVATAAAVIKALRTDSTAARLTAKARARRRAGTSTTSSPSPRESRAWAAPTKRPSVEAQGGVDRGGGEEVEEGEDLFSTTKTPCAIQQKRGTIAQPETAQPTRKVKLALVEAAPSRKRRVRAESRVDRAAVAAAASNRGRRRRRCGRRLMENGSALGAEGGQALAAFPVHMTARDSTADIKSTAMAKRRLKSDEESAATRNFGDNESDVESDETNAISTVAVAQLTLSAAEA